jgi:hypothetical protein
MVRACDRPGCSTLTMGGFCFDCERELGIEFRFEPRTLRRAATATGDAPVPSRPAANGAAPSR